MMEFVYGGVAVVGRGVLSQFVGLSLLVGAPAFAASAFRDHVDLGNEALGGSHELRLSGEVKAEKLATTVGTVAVTYPVRSVKGPGATLAFILRGVAPGTPALLEIQEIHDRRPHAFGYTVRVNDQDLYFRTYQEMGAGPNHYFINIPAGVLRPDGRVHVVLQSEGPAPFSVRKAWLYADFFGGAAAMEGTYQKMGIYVHPNDVVKGKSLEEAAALYKNTYSGFDLFGPPNLLSLFGYANTDIATVKATIDKDLKLTADTGMPMEFTANGSCYGGAVSGPDGLGGDFHDVQYNPVAWNPMSGRRNASWPNLWNNVPSHTWANPHLREILREKFRQVITHMSERLSFMMAEGTLPEGQYQFVRELGIASDMFSDYNPANIAAALKDGVVLDPRDGFSPEERMWLFNSITRIYEWMARDFAAALGRCPVQVDRGQVRLPREQWLDAIYMHTQMTDIRPLADRRWYGWQTGVHPDAWSSGEFDVGTVIDDYLRAQGILAKINQERHSLKDKLNEESQHQYEAGYRFVGYYAMHPGDEEFYRRVDKCGDDPARPILHFDPTCLDVCVDRDSAIGPSNQVLAVENLEARPTPSWHHTSKIVVKDPARPGSVLYRVSNMGEPFPSGLNMTVMGRVSEGRRNRIEVAAGDRPDRLSRVKVLTAKDLPNPDRWRNYQTSETTVDLGEGAKGKREYYIRLTFHSDKVFDAAFLHELRVGMKWARRSGPVAGAGFTCRQARTLSLWVQDRAFAERCLARYRSLGGEDETWLKARALVEDGFYKSAQKVLVGPVSELLPARYAVCGFGQLGKYPVTVTLADTNRTLLVELEKAGADGAAFSFKTEVEQPVKIEWKGLQSGRAYRLAGGAGNRYRLEPAPDAASGRVAEDGKLAIDLVVKPGEARKALPGKLSGVYVGGHPKKITVRLQDLELSNYSSSLAIPVATNRVVSRRPDRLVSEAALDGVNRWPQPNDRVDLTLNGNGEVTAIEAAYGIDRGIIKSFKPPSFESACNGIVEFDNGRKYEFNVGADCDTVFLHNKLIQYEIETWAAAFKPGHELAITYCPFASHGRLPRILSAKQPYEVLLDEDYTRNTNSQWRSQAVDIKGAKVVSRQLDPNYLVNWIQPVLYPDKPFVPGYAIYKIESAKPFDQVCVEFIGRVFEDSSRVEFLVADDPKAADWKSCGVFDNGWMNFIPMAPFADDKRGVGKYAFVDVSGAVRGRTCFYLKVQVTRHADDQRYGLARVRVVSSGSR